MRRRLRETSAAGPTQLVPAAAVLATAVLARGNARTGDDRDSGTALERPPPEPTSAGAPPTCEALARAESDRFAARLAASSTSRAGAAGRAGGRPPGAAKGTDAMSFCPVGPG
jgi:hypothetical protein